MKTLTERLNIVRRYEESGRADATSFDARKDVNYRETLQLHCANHNIDLNNIEQDDFDACAEIIGDFASGSARDGGDIISFWIDK